MNLGSLLLGAFLIVLGLVWAGAVTVSASTLGIFAIIVGCVILLWSVGPYVGPYFTRTVVRERPPG